MNVCYANPIGNNWKFVNSARKKSIPIFFAISKESKQNKTKQSNCFQIFLSRSFQRKIFQMINKHIISHFSSTPCYYNSSYLQSTSKLSFPSFVFCVLLWAETTFVLKTAKTLLLSRSDELVSLLRYFTCSQIKSQGGGYFWKNKQFWL